jgi:hypothetical protein
MKMDGWKKVGMVFLVILAVIGAGAVFFFVTCVAMLSAHR